MNRRLFSIIGRASAIALAALSAFIASQETQAQTKASEPELKAAIISNMLLFVEWPKSPSLPADQLTICFVDASPVANALLQLNGKNIKGKSLKVMPLLANNAGECHALYVSPANSANLNKTLAGLATLPIFLTGDSDGFLRQGGMLNLELVGDHIVFDINLRGAQKAGLQISSKALRLARQVIE